MRDSTTVSRGGTVSTLDGGAVSVLDNDFDLEGDPMTAVLEKSVKHGELTLNDDGTFVYRHNGDSSDSDGFQYRAHDGTGFSRRTRVRIEILAGDPIPPQIVGQDTITINEDESIEIDIRDLVVVDPDSRFPADFTLEVNDGENYTRSGMLILPAPDYNGPISVPVRVFDGSSFSNVFRLAADVLPQNDSPIAIGAPPDQEAFASEPFQLPLAEYFADIDENDSFSFSALGLPESGSLRIDAVSGVLSGIPVGADARDAAYNVEVFATDLGGQTASVRFQLVILPDNRADLAVTATLSANPVSVGETAQWNIVIENNGPADLESGELVAQWTTSGPDLALSAPQHCVVSNNDSRTPGIRCALMPMAAKTSAIFNIQGIQETDGDNSLIAIAVADDPRLENNSSLTSSQVVAAFSEGPTQILNVSGADVAAGDLNGDSEADLVITSAETFLFLNNGKRSVMTPGISLGSNSGGTVVVILDWNGDTRPDIAVAGMPDKVGYIFINDGAGNFDSDGIDLRVPGLGVVASAVAADFDQDGFTELVLTGTQGTTMLKGTGQSTFSEISLSAGPGIDASVTDLNNDDFADIIIVEAADRVVRLLTNSGNGTSFAAQSISSGSVASATALDLDDDGKVDLLLAIDGTDLTVPESQVLYQQANGGFSVGESLGASSLSEMLAGDIDGDLVSDIVALNEAGVHQLYGGHPAGGFALTPEQIVSAGMRRGVLVDFNSDQSLDLIMAGPESDVVEIHANNGVGRLGLGDRIPPVIQLIGESRVDLPAGAPYEESGATAYDDIDGDLTDAIVIESNVNSTVVGSYHVSYRVADRATNVATVQRVVNVGVNSGTGGGGGGLTGPLSIMFLGLAMIAAAHRKIRSN